jgi:hypothetical protein
MNAKKVPALAGQVEPTVRHHAQRTMTAKLEDGSIVQLTCSAPFEKASAAMEAALMMLDDPIVYREPVGLIGALRKWWRGS